MKKVEKFIDFCKSERIDDDDVYLKYIRKTYNMLTEVSEPQPDSSSLIPPELIEITNETAAPKQTILVENPPRYLSDFENCAAWTVYQSNLDNKYYQFDGIRKKWYEVIY